MITTIRLQNFRSYADESFDLSPGVNIIVGPNASGKTNLLEAVLLLARGGSYRTKDGKLVHFDSDWARLDANLPSHNRVVKIKHIGDSSVSEKVFEFDDQKVTRLHHTRMLPVVLFEPDHLSLLTGSPDARRLFIDDLIEQLKPQYGAIRKQFKRVLGHRNALLKQNPPSIAQQLFVWNLRLSELAGQIVKERQWLVEQFSSYAQEVYSSLSSDTKDLSFVYESKLLPLGGYETSLLKKLEGSLELDIKRGFTGNGPHRDDLGVYLDGKPVIEVASRGEIRTIILVLKVTELKLLEDILGQPPILLLDDVFSELDTRRRQALTSYVSGYQTFITTTDADVVVQHFTDCNIIPLKSLTM